MNLTSNAPEDYLGSKIGGYTLVRVLGTGSTGIVFLGEHPEHLTENVAIKICIPPLHFTAEEREIFQTRFLREAEAMQRLHHPHIVPVLQRGTENGVLYTVFYYMQGGTLADRLVQHPQGLEFDEIEHIVRQIAGALDTAHAIGMVHRDVKPTNIFFDRPEIFTQQDAFSPYDEAYLGDFGIVHLFSQSRITLTALGQVLGTPEYMAPEQAEGEAVTPAADIYGLGAVVYELVTGHVPFTATQPVQLLLQVVQVTPPSPRKSRPELSVTAEAAIMRALEKDPALRFASAGAFAAAFVQGTDGEASTADDAIAALPRLIAQDEFAAKPDTAARLAARHQQMPPLFATTGPSSSGSYPSPSGSQPVVATSSPSSALHSVWSRLSTENMLALLIAMVITTVGTLLLIGHQTKNPSTPSTAVLSTSSLTMTTALTTSSVTMTTTATTPSSTAALTPIPLVTSTVGVPASAPTATPGQIVPPPAAPTAIPVPASTMLFNFEDGQVWQKLGDQIHSVVSSTDKAYDGSHSLEVKFTNVTTTTYPETFTNQAEHMPTATTLTMALYLPAGIGAIKAQLFVILPSGDFDHSEYVSLAPGAWTVLHYPLPSQTYNQTAVNLGVQFFAGSGTVNGSIYIDHVEFGTA